MLIAIVDDNLEKRAEAIRIVKEAGGADVEIREADSLVGARRLLQADVFDLLILDIALPEREGDQARLDGGISLLDEVIASNRFKMPTQVIGLTALDQVYEDAAARFGSELWSVLRYDRSSTEWAERLAAKVRHLLRLKSVDRKGVSEIDLGIVVALKDPELDAVLALPWNWRKLDSPDDPTVYYLGEFERRDGTKGRAVAARTGQMGMPAATALGTKLAMTYRPRVLAMVGICAGNKDDTSIGDLVVANPTWDYGSGKHSIKNEKEVFEPAPYPLALTSRVRGVVEPFEGESAALTDIRKKFGGAASPTMPKLHIGPFASGAAVVARAAMVQEVQLQHRKLLAIDMEAYGIAIAATESVLPVPEFIIVKGVSDFADEDKGDSRRDYAAFMSAQFLGLICTSHDLC